MNTLLLSGFETFGDYPVNSSELIATRLDSKELSGFKIMSHVFPCTVTSENRAKNLFEIALQVHASGIICLGMASEKKGLCIETVGINAFNSNKYCPELSGRKVYEEMDYGARMELDLTAWNLNTFQAKCIMKGFEKPEISEQPGGFCCNQLIIQMRYNQVSNLRFSSIPFIFIHIPCTPESVKDRQEFQEEGKMVMMVEEVIRRLELLIAYASLRK